MLRIAFLVFLNIVIAVLILFSIYVGLRFYRAFTQNQSLVVTLFDYRDLLLQLNIIKEEEWKMFDAPSFTFEHPIRWEPKQRELLGGETELIDLKIPVIFNITKIAANNVIGYAKEEVSSRRPVVDLLVENDIVIGNRNAKKWIYKKNGYIIYEYILPLQRYSLNGKNVSAFYLRVESTTRNDKLEETLDRVAASVKFKADELEPGAMQ